MLQVYAQSPIVISSGCNPGTLCRLVGDIIGYLNLALYLLMAVAIVMFVWYIIQYFIKPDTEKKEAGSYLLYSVIGFVVILSIWGIVAIVGNSLGVGNSYNVAPTWSSFSNLFPR